MDTKNVVKIGLIKSSARKTLLSGSTPQPVRPELSAELAKMRRSKGIAQTSSIKTIELCFIIAYPNEMGKFPSNILNNPIDHFFAIFLTLRSIRLIAMLFNENSGRTGIGTIVHNNLNAFVLEARGKRDYALAL